LDLAETARLYSPALWAGCETVRVVWAMPAAGDSQLIRRRAARFYEVDDALRSLSTRTARDTPFPSVWLFGCTVPNSCNCEREVCWRDWVLELAWELVPVVWLRQQRWLSRSVCFGATDGRMLLPMERGSASECAESLCMRAWLRVRRCWGLQRKLCSDGAGRFAATCRAARAC
jgi:hypothetical protein